MNPASYYASLPGKRMGAGVLFFNDKKELLILKPSYKEHWTVPGGVIDKDESPRDAAVREVKEEIGLDIDLPRFIGVDYKVNKGDGDNLQFSFYGGVLSDIDIHSIELRSEEIVEYKFIEIVDVQLYLSPSLRIRLPKLVDAINNNCPIYLENGL